MGYVKSSDRDKLIGWLKLVLKLFHFFFFFQDSIRAVLGNLDNLQPFATEHFIVFPCILSFLGGDELQFTL